MLITDWVKIKINKKNIDYYENNNYKCKIGKYELIKTEHLSVGTSVVVIVMCDYCHCILERKYSAHLQYLKKSVIKKDCCISCSSLKLKESMMKLHGVSNTFQLKNTKQKTKETLLKKYGVSNIMHHESVNKFAKNGYGNYELEVLKATNGEFYVLDKDLKNKKMTYRHELCGNIQTILISSFRDSKKLVCYKCKNINLKKTHEEFSEEVKNISNNTYICHSLYKSAHRKIELKHLPCGNILTTTPNTFLKSPSLCPNCHGKKSKYEHLIEMFLIENHVNYQREYKIEECKNIKALPFDFAIFDNNKKLKLLIEYDGIQHFKPMKHFGGENVYIEMKKRDLLKNKFCLDNDLNLIRINYLQIDEMFAILKKELVEVEILKND